MALISPNICSVSAIPYQAAVVLVQHYLYEDPHAGNVPFLLHYGDMTDSTNVIRLMQQIRPTEIYNLAAQSHVGVSFESPEYTANADGIGVL